MEEARMLCAHCVSDMSRMHFLVRVLTAAGDKGFIPAAPWSAWWKKPDREAMRAYRNKLTLLLTGPEEGIPMAMADIAWRTLRLLHASAAGPCSCSMDAAGVVGMLMRFLYDQLPGAADQIEEACLKAVCSHHSNVEQASEDNNSVEGSTRFTVCLRRGGSSDSRPDAYYNDVPTLQRAREVAIFLRKAALADGWPQGSSVEISGDANWLVQGPYWTLKGRRWIKGDQEAPR